MAGRGTRPLPRPTGTRAAEAPLFAIHAESKGIEKSWRDLTVSHGGKLRFYYDYLSQTPLTPLGERVFEMKGPLAGTWECEVGGGARFYYVVDQIGRRVVIRKVETSHG